MKKNTTAQEAVRCAPAHACVRACACACACACCSVNRLHSDEAPLMYVIH